MTKEKNYYRLLEVDKYADTEQIKQAYFKQIKKYHPDTFVGDKTFAEQITAELNIAYDTLNDNTKRDEYDKKLGIDPSKKYKINKKLNTAKNKQEKPQQTNAKSQKEKPKKENKLNKTKNDTKPEKATEQNGNLKEKRLYDFVIIILLLLIIALILFKF